MRGHVAHTLVRPSQYPLSLDGDLCLTSTCVILSALLVIAMKTTPANVTICTGVSCGRPLVRGGGNAVIPAPIVLPDSDPVPTVGSGGGYAGLVQLPSDRPRTIFITSCGLDKAIVILNAVKNLPRVTQQRPAPPHLDPSASLSACPAHDAGVTWKYGSPLVFKNLRGETKCFVTGSIEGGYLNGLECGKVRVETTETCHLGDIGCRRGVAGRRRGGIGGPWSVGLRTRG